MRYDLAVVGGGPAGYSAALEAVDFGLRVVLFEHREIGGTCLNRGCVPTKFLAHAAELYSRIQNASDYGISAKGVSIEYAMTLQRKQEIVSQLRTGLEQTMRQGKIDIIQKTARVTGQGGIYCDGRRYEAENILIATGSSPAQPLVSGAITSDELLELGQIPESLKIIGGGVVAVEFAHIFSSLGTKVTLCLRSERILRKWDRELSVSLAQRMKQKGIIILTNCSMEQMEEIKAELTLSATGRIPNIEGVFENGLDVQLNDGIVTDVFGQTSIPGIFAAGDVIAGSCQLAHVGMEQGRRVADYIAGRPLCKPAAVIRCIYTQPEIASVGLDEAEARKEGIRTVTGKQTMYANARTLISGGERGFIKLVADAENGRVLGAQLMCGRASDIAGELALAVNSGLAVQDLVCSVRPHPSFCEEISRAAESLLEKLR